MRLNSRQAELFEAFSAITAKVFSGNRLLACPTLSKAPNYGNVLRRFILGYPRARPGPKTWLRIAFRYCLSNGAHFLFMLLGAAYIRMLGWSLPKAALLDSENPLLLIDGFAVLPRLEKEGRYRELYLPGLAREAEATGHTVVHLYRLYGSRDPRTLWRAFRALAEHGGMTEAHLLRFSDWFRLLWHALSYPFALARLIRSLKAYPAKSPQSCIRDALIHTAGQCVLIGEARRLAARRLGFLLAARPFSISSGNHSGSDGNRAATHVVSWYENQTVNKCFMRGLAEAEARTGRHVPVTGAQLSLWPAALLNNHPDDGEAALGLVPERVLVNGPHFLPEHSRQQYAVGPSLRYAALFEKDAAAARAEPELARAPSGRLNEASAAKASPAEAFAAELPAVEKNEAAGIADGVRMPLLVLLSYYPEEVRRVLEMALPLAESGAEVIYKFHPTAKPEQYKEWLPPFPAIADGPLSDALEDIRRRRGAVLGSVSGALVEAVVAGVPVLSVEELYPELGMNFLPERGKGLLWEPVGEREDVEKALSSLQKGLDLPGREKAVHELRDLLFTEPTRERIHRDFLL